LDNAIKYLYPDKNSQIIPRIPLRSPHILPHIAPESQHHVNNNGGAHRKEGSVHKVLPYFTGGNPHPVADGRTNAKGIPFHKAFEFVHSANLVDCHKRSKKALFTPCFFLISPHLLTYFLKILPWYLI
jgi:hypothetical protein